MNGMSLKTSIESPVLVTGYPRSGTTMLWSVLLRHHAFKPGAEALRLIDEEIVRKRSAVETAFFSLLKKRKIGPDTFFARKEYPYWYEFFGGDELEIRAFLKEVDAVFAYQGRLDAAYERIPLSLRSRTAAWTRFRGVRRLLWSVRGNRFLARKFALHALRGTRARRLLEKTPRHVSFAEECEFSFRRPRVIFLLRHPVDVYASHRKRLANAGQHHPSRSWLDVSVSDFCQDYQALYAAFHGHGEKNRLLVKYEDLCGRPGETFREICRFIGEAQDADCLAGEVPEMRADDAFPLHSHVPVNNSGHWEGWVSRGEADSIQTSLRDILRRHAYVAY